MEVRKNKLKRVSGIGYRVSDEWKTRKNVGRVPANPAMAGRTRRQLLTIATWILVFCLLAQPVLALTANVRIEGPSGTIFEDDVTTSSTTINGETFGPNIAVSALGAAAKVGGFKVEYGAGPFINSIAGISNKADWSESWLYRLNGNFNDLVGVGSQTIVDKKANLLFFYGAWPWPKPPKQPLNLEVSKNNVTVNDEFTLTTTYYDDKNAAFEPISATIKIGGSTLQTDKDGKLTTSLSNIGTYLIYAEKDGLIKSNTVKIIAGQVISPTVELSSIVSQAKTKQITTKRSKLTSARRKIYIHKALDYLRKKQSKDGKIVNPSVSAWAAMAFASVGLNPNKLKRLKGIPKKKWRSLMDYLEKYTKTSLNRKWLKKHSEAVKPLATDYARQIMAVSAANRNPRNFGGLNLVKELLRFYRKKQFGSTSLINDDIFAILALKSAKVKSTDHRIRKSVQIIAKNQHTDGGFSYNANKNGSSDVDTTAAAIQALVIARRTGIKNLSKSINKAYDFLTSKQQTDGGFAYGGAFDQSNSSSTAWVVQAIASLKGAQAMSSLSTANGATPLHFLADSRSAGGGFGYGPKSDNDAWTTTQVIQALAKKPWLGKVKRNMKSKWKDN